MAKLKGPLFSLGASQQLGKALVFFPWKGLNVVREYVIPSNPQTKPQTTQRGYLTAAVTAIHAAQVDPENPFNADDASAYALLGSRWPTPRTWFNEIVKQWIDQLKVDKDAIVWSAGLITPKSKTLEVFLGGHAATGAEITDGFIHYGTSKTALLYTKAATPGELAVGIDIDELTPGVKYYVQYRPNTPDTYVGANSGLYYGVPLA